MATTPFDVLGPGPGQAGVTNGGNLPALFDPMSDPGAMAPPGLPGPGSPPQFDPMQSIRGNIGILTPEPPKPAIEKLRPGSDAHKFVLDKLEAMFDFGKKEMKKHYDRWNFGEQKIQAYASVQDYDKLLGSLADNARPPEPIQVILPYSYATLHAAATFVASVLLGQKPMFPLVATRGTETERARYMELAIQSHLDASRGYEQLWQHIWDSLIYGFAVNRCQWEERTGPTIRWIGGQREMTTEINFAGNVLSCIDPYAIAPDPRVPLSECNIRGDFMFTEMQQSETVLKDMEKQGMLKWVDEAIKKNKHRNRYEGAAVQDNRRRIKIGIRGEHLITPNNVVGFHKVFEGTVRLIPKDWKLGDQDRSELWKFSWMKDQIVQAEPLGMVHGQHPYTLSEPTSFGHDFMSVAMSDMIGPFQDIMSWLISSRMENVRAAINNQFVADPARVEVNDIRSSAIGRIIRLKQAAMGLPVKEAIMQLIVQDVTTGHLNDIQTMRVLADTITGVNDNMRGIQNPGGRKSATEARISMQAGASRLSQLAVRISCQAMMPLCNQMIYNIQQFMPEQMWVEMTGDDGVPSSNQLTPEMLVGSFNYQISDGSLPFDKLALVEVWKEILFGVAREPELRQNYDINEIFNYVAQLSGAKNIDSFKKPPPPPQLPGQQPGVPFEANAQPNPGGAGNLMALGPAQPAGPMMT